MQKKTKRKKQDSGEYCMQTNWEKFPKKTGMV